MRFEARALSRTKGPLFGQLVVLATLVIFSGCSEKMPTEIGAETKGSGALINAPKFDFRGRTLFVLGEDSETILAAAVIGKKGRVGTGISLIELRNLPPGWLSVVLSVDKENISNGAVLVDRNRPSDMSYEPQSGRRLPVGALIWLGVAGLYGISVVGVSGGPNHGDHPMMVNLIHGTVFIATGWHWVGPLKWIYAAFIGSALVLSVFVVPIRVWSYPRLTWAARAVMLVLYLGMATIVVKRPDYRPVVGWAGQQAVQMDFPENLQGPFSFLDVDGTAVFNDSLVSDGDRRVIVFLNRDIAPMAVQAGEEVLELGDRPSEN